MGAALVVTLLVLGTTILAGDSPGELEVETTLAGTNAEARVEVREIGEGRLISLQSDQLEVLPTGEYYEVWFVGPGDTPENPNRVSAGTFHPDPQGRTDIELFGAVNPEKLPRIEITAEPGDGDPSPSGDVVVSGG